MLADAADPAALPHRQLGVTRGFPSGAPVVIQQPRQLQAPRPVQPVPAPMPSSIAPLESVAKLVGLPTGCFPSFVFYATHLPFTIGRGAPHVRMWAHGDHAMVTERASHVAPTACTAGPARANRRLLTAGLGLSLLPNAAPSLEGLAFLFGASTRGAAHLCGGA